MQKHERECLRGAQEEAAKLSGDLTATSEHRHSKMPKMRIVLRGPGGTRIRTLPSSPRDQDDLVDHVCQWVRRAAREIV